MELGEPEIYVPSRSPSKSSKKTFQGIKPEKP
jgi:hypothetical protein